MSMLLGVRGSSRENEGQPIREGIIQQPSPFYNGNPSSCIWGNPPTPPLWRDSPFAPSSSSSSSALSSASSSSSASPTSVRASTMEQQPRQYREQQQRRQHIPKARGEQPLDEQGTSEDSEDSEEKEVARGRRAAECRSSEGRQQQSSNLAGPSLSSPVISPFSFGFPPQSTSSVLGRGYSTASDPSQFSTVCSVRRHEVEGGLSRASGKLPVEGGRGISGASLGTNTVLKNHRGSSSGRSVLPDDGLGQGFVFGTPYSIDNLTEAWGLGLGLQSGESPVSSSASCPPLVSNPTVLASQFSSMSMNPPISSSFQSTSSEGVKEPVPNSAGINTAGLFSTVSESTSEASASTSARPAPMGTNGIRQSAGQKEGQEVFVFGASGVPGVSQQNHFPFSVLGAAPRSRFVKVKKHGNAIKGKGPAAVAGTGSVQMASEFLDPSALSNAGTGSAAEASHFDDGECSGSSDAGIPFVDPSHENMKSGRSSEQESLQVPPWLKAEATSGFGADRSNRQPTWYPKSPSNVANDQYQSVPNVHERIFKAGKKENQQTDHMQTVNEHFNFWHPFSQNTNEGFMEVNDKARAQVQHPLNEGMPFRSGVAADLFRGETADGVLSEEHVANVIAGFANFGGPLGKQEKSGKSNADADAGRANRMTESSNTSDANHLSTELPRQGDGAVEGSQNSGGEGFGSDSSTEPFVKEQIKEALNHQALFEQFSKLGQFQVSPDGRKENQEPKSQSSSKKSQEPFVFRASKTIPSSISSAGRVDSSTGFHAINASGNTLPSFGLKSGNDKYENVKETEECAFKGNVVSTGYEYVQRSGDGGSAAPSFPSFKAGAKIGLGFVNDGQTRQSSSFSQPFMFSAGSFVATPVSSLYSGMSPFESMQQSHPVETRDGGPVGEFAGPASSSESSASECSPTRGEEQWPGADVSSSPRHSFEFRGSTKGMSNGTASRKKKAQRVSSRQSKQLLHKAKRNITGSGGLYTPLSKTTHGAGSPMDCSPRFEMEPEVVSPLGGSTNMPNLEQPAMSWGATAHSVDSEADYRDEWEHIVEEDPRVEELRAAAAGLSIGNEQGNDASNDDCEGYHDSTGRPFWWTGSDISAQRTGKFKRSAFEGEHSAFTEFEDPLPNVQAEKDSENEGEFYNHTTLNGEGSNQRRRFTFTANSPPTVSSSMLRRHARRIQRERATGTVADTGKLASPTRGADSTLSTGGYETSVTAGLGNVPMAAAAQAVSHDVLHTTDVNIRQNSVTKAAPVGQTSRSPAYTKDGGKTVPAFFPRTTELSTDSSVSGQRFDAGMPASPSAVKSAAAEQVCERWRLRGNQAYANGDFPRAEEYYSRGASSVSPNETSQSCIRASMLCYSNRAATRMATGRMREALADCMCAILVDPNFLRVRLRAASCHLALGESKAAASMFKDCLKYAKEGNKPDSKIATEAMEGVKKTQQLDDYSDRAMELLEKGNSTDATTALRLLNEALLTSPHSEHLLEMKAQVLFSLRRHEEVVQLCEQSLASAERNHGSVLNDQQHQDNSSGEPSVGGGNSSLKLWRWRMTAKSLYHLGRLEESLNLLMKHEEASLATSTDKSTNMLSGSTDSLAPLVSNIRDLLRHKAAGNEAFQSGKHAEAVEHYTAALACTGESRPYNAVCFCNRAAASQALGHIADAIADCSRAIALDPNYPKAISRRATLHDMVRDYGQVSNDLTRLITLLENYQQQGKNNQSSRVGGSNSNIQDLRQARDRLAKAEEEMKKGHPVDHYLILGVDPLCTANEIKKAYRKAALKHHPDKAGQFLVRGENGDDGSVWKEVGDEVRRDAERLFKMIGEAYAILSDPTKRLRYDTDEELRKLRVRSGTGTISGTPEAYRSQYEKGGRRQRERWDTWNGYAHQYQRWQSGPDAAQPDTYARRSNYASNDSKSSRTVDFDWDEI